MITAGEVSGIREGSDFSQASQLVHGRTKPPVCICFSPSPQLLLMLHLIWEEMERPGNSRE